MDAQQPTTAQELEILHVTDNLTHGNGFTVYRITAPAVSGVLTVGPFRPGSALDAAEQVFAIEVVSGLPDLLDNRYVPDGDRAARLTIDGYTFTGAALLHVRPGRTDPADLVTAANEQQKPAAPKVYGEIAAALALAWLTDRDRADVRYAAYAPATRASLRTWRRAAKQAETEAQAAAAKAAAMNDRVTQATGRLNQLQTERETT